MKLIRKAGQTSQILQIFVRDRTSTIGAGLTGLAFNTASLTAYYHRDTDTTATAISLVTMTVGTFTSSGFKEIDSTNMPGWYQFCPPNAAIAAGAGSVSFHLKGGGNMADLPIEMDLDAQVDVTTWNGTAVSSPSTAGIPEVNIKNINNVSAASVTTVNANLGQTQPVNFTGTGSSALIKSDTVDIAGSAVSTSTAQIGVNAVNLGGTAQTGRDIGASVLLSTGTGTGQLDFTSGVVKANLAQILGTALTETAGQIAAAFKQFFNIASPTGTVNLIPAVTTVTTTTTATNLTNAPTSGDFTATMKTSLNAATPASVTGAVGSVTARVTANTDQLAGQTVTAGASVTFPASVASPTNITAGTITTATNLTNAPTAGDFTATMKTSLNSSSPGISATGVQAIWDALTSALTTTGSIGKLLVGMAASVWDVVLSGHTTGGTTGAALNAASSAGDPWATALPGAYSSGTAGNIVGNNLNATVSSRLPTASITLSAGAVTVGTNNDKTGYALTAGYDPAKTAAQAGDAMALTSGERSTLAGVIWANATRTLTSFGTLVADAATAVWGATTRTLSAFGFTVATDVSSTVTTNLDATVSSRLATAGYTAPDNSDIVAIKAKTDNLPASPAAVGSAMTLTGAYDAAKTAAQVSDIPTATQNADALLKRDMSAVTGEAARSPLNALRILRNKMSISGSTLTVTKEDDSTSAWTAAVGTTSGADPVTSVDPT